jgi:type I restriction enzyme, S subunit
MNPDRLLQHFDQISEAPDAVPRLRRFILDLAVRGKLVEQDPEDEPAGELLKRIEVEKARLSEIGKVPKSVNKLPKDAIDVSFGTPEGWIWCRLADLSLRIHYGYTASAKKNLQEVRLLRITDIQNSRVQWESVPGCEIDGKQVNQYLLSVGDFLIARTGGTIGKSFLVMGMPLRAVFASYLIRIQPSKHLFDRYLKVFFDSTVYWKQIEEGSRGAGQPNVNGQTLGRMAVPLPPLAEQHRIVAKVNELMALCDDLEAAQTKREKRRNRLVAATLQGIGRDGSPSRPQLNQPPSSKQPGRDVSLKRPLSPKLARGGAFGEKTLTCALGDSALPNDAFPNPQGGAFGEHALPIFFNHLPRLTTRPEHIRQLRQTILNLAIRGKLVPQDPRDEPASDLMNRIKKWHSEAITRKIIRPPRKSLKEIGPNETPYTLPNGWAWARLGEIISIHSGDGLTSENMNNGNIPVYGGNGISGYHDAFNLKEPTIVIGRVGYYCGSIHVTPQRAWVTDNVFITKFNPEEINLEFLVLLLKGSDLKENENATAQPVISGSKIYPIIIGIPPHAEQKRIVAKVDELMAPCNELEARITTTSTTRRQFLEATLYNALHVVKDYPS